jgi:short-subunit dehydrogenase
MKSRSFVITGGTSGIGLHLAKTLPVAGDRLLILSQDDSKFRSISKNLEKNNIKCEFTPVNFQQASKFEDRILDSIDNFGQVDVLINNVGASLKYEGSCNAEQFLEVLQINLISTHILTKSVLTNMKPRGFGKIITISSMAAFDLKGPTPYVVAKGALDHYILKSAMEISASGVIHVGIRPGPVNVPGRYLTNLEENLPEKFLEWCIANNYLPKKLCTMGEIERLIRYIVNDSGPFINGSIINLGGGNF